jgi:hypothetical protein
VQLFCHPGLASTSTGTISILFFFSSFFLLSSHVCLKALWNTMAEQCMLDGLRFQPLYLSTLLTFRVATRRLKERERKREREKDRSWWLCFAILVLSIKAMRRLCRLSENMLLATIRQGRRPFTASLDPNRASLEVRAQIPNLTYV